MRIRKGILKLGAAAVVLCAALLLPTPETRAQNPEELMPAESAAKAKAILQQAIEGLGGKDYLNVHNSECSGRYAQFQHSGATGGYILVRLYHEMPDKDRVEYGMDVKARIIDVYAGDKGWTLDRGGVSDIPAEDLGDRQEQLKTQLGNVLRNRLDEPGLFFRYGGSDVVDLREVDWVEIGDGGRTMRIAVNRKDHLPTRSIVIERDPKTGDRNERASYYTTYHLIDGIQTPFNESRFLNGRQTYEVFLDSCSYDVDLPGNFFTREALEERFSELNGKSKKKK